MRLFIFCLTSSLDSVILDTFVDPKLDVLKRRESLLLVSMEGQHAHPARQNVISSGSCCCFSGEASAARSCVHSGR